jgi:hypothetical protein
MDQVVCINDDWPFSQAYNVWKPPSVPVKGVIYTPIRVRKEYGAEYYVLAEFIEPWGWRTDHIRPVIKKTDISCFTGALTTKKLEDA